MDTVKVGIADKDCMGIDNPITKECYHVRNHVAEMPRREAEKLLRTNYGGDASIMNISHGYTKKFAEGWERIFGGGSNVEELPKGFETQFKLEPEPPEKAVNAYRETSQVDPQIDPYAARRPRKKAE